MEVRETYTTSDRSGSALYFEDVRAALPEEYRYLLQYPTIKNYVSNAHDQKLDVDTITRNIVNLWEWLDWNKKKPQNEGELTPPMSPEDFVRLVKETKYSKTSTDPYKWEQKLTDYRRVQKRKWKIGTSNNKCGAVTSFLSSNYVKDFKFTWESREDPDIFAPTLQELRLIFASTKNIELKKDDPLWFADGPLRNRSAATGHGNGRSRSPQHDQIRLAHRAVQRSKTNAVLSALQTLAL